MAQKILGVDPFGDVPSTTQKHELGLVVSDVRGGQGQVTKSIFPNGGALQSVVTKYDPGAKFKYVKATGTISAGDAVQLDVAATADERHASVIRTSAVDQSVEGVALAAMTTGQFGWIQIGGRVWGANVATAAAAGDVLGSSATAGRLATATPSAANAYATATGRGIRAMTAGSSNTADILIQD